MRVRWMDGKRCAAVRRRWIGLAAPRVLLRRPYGQRSDPIDSFTFDEFEGAPPQEELLWGHASLRRGADRARLHRARLGHDAG